MSKKWQAQKLVRAAESMDKVTELQAQLTVARKAAEEEMVTEAELVNEWHWIAEAEGDHRVFFCPECQ